MAHCLWSVEPLESAVSYKSNCRAIIELAKIRSLSLDQLELVQFCCTVLLRAGEAMVRILSSCLIYPLTLFQHVWVSWNEKFLLPCALLYLAAIFQNDMNNHRYNT